MASQPDRALPNTFTTNWPEGPFVSNTDPGGAAAAQMMARIAGQIAFRRAHKGWTQRRLADESGLSESTLSRIESGSTWPELKGLVRLCAVLGVVLTLVWPETDLEEDSSRHGRTVTDVPDGPGPSDTPPGR